MPRTEQQRQKRAERRRKRRARQAEGATTRQVAVVGSPQPAELKTAPSAAAASTAAPIPSTQQIVGAIGELVEIVNDLKESMIGAVGELAQGQQELHNRIATIEQAQ